QASGPVGQLDVDGDYVRGPQQIVERDETQAELDGPLGGGIYGPGLHVHADRPGQPCGGCPDVAGANDTEGFARQEDVIHGVVPTALLELLSLEPKAAGGGQHQGQGVLGDDGRGTARNVADDNTLVAGRFQVNRIGADAAGSNHLEAR